MTSSTDPSDRLRAALSTQPGVVATYLFGSVAEGRAHRESDVDVGVLLSRDRFPTAVERFDVRLRLLSTLAGGVAREVDLVILNDAPPQLARHIMCGGRLLLVNDHALDHEQRRLVLSRAADLEPFLRRTRAVKLRAIRGETTMTYLVDRLAELRRYLRHLHALAPRVTSSEALTRDLPLHNDVMFSLLMTAQLVIDIAGELSARRGDRFEDYAEAVRNLARDRRFPAELIDALARVPGFRNVIIHEYAMLDLQRVVEALHTLEPIERFMQIVADIEASE